MMRTTFPWITAILIVVLDRLSKMAILRNIEPGSWLPVFPGLTLTHVHNRGIAFSLFSDGGPLTRIILHAVIVSAILVIAWILVRQADQHLAYPLAFGLILGGAVGNLIDRVIYGWVIDFIHCWVRLGERTFAWPDFNVADSAISCGAVLLIILELRSSHKNRRTDASDPD
jgi:signal peptidase II